jgi:hypothetical protein
MVVCSLVVSLLVIMCAFMVGFVIRRATFVNDPGGSHRPPAGLRIAMSSDPRNVSR